MERKTTELNPKQLKARDALITGRTITEAASDAGVHRSTVHRMLDDAEFVASLNARRSELRPAADSRLDHLQAKALDALEAALDDGNARIALALLKGVGLLDGEKPYIGSTTAEGAAMSLIADRKSRERHELLSGFG
jgi:hypothetical protein